MQQEKHYTLSSQAAKDIADISAYIARDKTQAAAKLVFELAETFILIASMPEMGRKNTEIHKTHRFFPHGQYLILYKSKNQATQHSASFKWNAKYSRCD